MQHDEKYTAICKNLKQIRKARGYTQEQVAAAIGIDRSSYAYYESGRSMPAFSTMDKIAKALNMSYTQLFASVDTDKIQSNPNTPKPDGNNCELHLSKLERSVVLRIRSLSPEQQNDLLYSLGGGVSN